MAWRIIESSSMAKRISESGVWRQRNHHQLKNISNNDICMWQRKQW